MGRYPIKAFYQASPSSSARLVRSRIRPFFFPRCHRPCTISIPAMMVRIETRSADEGSDGARHKRCADVRTGLMHPAPAMRQTILARTIAAHCHIRVLQTSRPAARESEHPYHALQQRRPSSVVDGEHARDKQSFCRLVPPPRTRRARCPFCSLFRTRHIRPLVSTIPARGSLWVSSRPGFCERLRFRVSGT